MEQNIYDNAHFFKEYQAMRKGTLSANDLIEIPEIRLMMPDLSGKRVLECSFLYRKGCKLLFRD